MLFYLGWIGGEQKSYAMCVGEFHFAKVAEEKRKEKYYKKLEERRKLIVEVINPQKIVRGELPIAVPKDEYDEKNYFMDYDIATNTCYVVEY